MIFDQFKFFERQFNAYADDYIARSSQPAPLQLKKAHSMRVCREIESLGEELALDEEARHLALTMALFHDLGRFRQFEEYKTFLDMKSVDHAALSLKELNAKGWLHECTSRESALIRGAIAVHNAAEVPNLEDHEKVFFMKLLRDADKLDIWHVVIDNYLHPDPDNRDTVNLGLEDHGGYAVDAVFALENHTYVRSSSIKELNDLKLMQISWVFDLNFPEAVAKVKKRKYIDDIVSSLSFSTIDPEHSRVLQAIDGVYDYMNACMTKRVFDFRCG